MAKVTVIQKERRRITFKVSQYANGDPKYDIEFEECLATGSSLSSRTVTKDDGNQFYTELMADGYKRFRKTSEVSWYATIENNTPYEEEWTTDGKYLIPIKSRSIA